MELIARCSGALAVGFPAAAASPTDGIARERVLLVAGHIPEGTIARILENTDIVDLISRYFPLKRAGQNYVGLCPFHSEKTPSFNVSPQRQIYHCFGCGKGGDAISFLMEAEKLPFPEAVSTLAERCGVTIEHTADAAVQSRRKGLYQVLSWAAKVFSGNLASPAGKAARDYLRGRGISDESITKFRLGYAETAWDSLIRHAREQEMPAKDLQEAGLLVAKEAGGHFDRFRHRVIFPITDTQDRVVGFGARALDPQEKAKYLNSPETPLFAKGKLLYGLSQAKNPIFQSEQVLVVEGYTDVIMAHQCGFDNAVATLGTALGHDHVRQIKRYAKRCTLVFDGDAAGQKASDTGIRLFVENEVDVAVAVLPPGKDPCDCLVEMGSEVFQKALDEARSVFEFRLRAAETDGRLTPKAAAAVADDVLDLIVRIPNTVERRLQLDRVAVVLSSQLDADEKSVRNRLITLLRESNRKNRPQRAEPPDEQYQPPVLHPVERELVTVCLHDQTLIPQLVQQVDADDLTHDGLRAIFEAMASLSEEGNAEPQHLSARTGEKHAQLLAELLSDTNGSTDYQDRFKRCLKSFERRKTSRLIDDVRQQMLAAARDRDSEKNRELQLEYARLKRQILTLEED